MSFYATIYGWIRYPTRGALDAALAELRARGWMNARGVFVDEKGRPMTSESTVDGLTLRIPLALYRNLAGFLDTLAAGAEHKIAWVSTDGVSAAGVMVNGEEVEYDLEEWAAEHEGPPDEDEDDDYWEEVEADFIDWAVVEWEIDPE